ncbi:MAG TPA: nitroreductase family protein [Desulfobacterales bacterium]|nr:nitroreductase family protein [Desulfobacterales bacterium]
MTDTCAFHDLVRRTRSVRRFQEDRAVDRQTLVELIDLARLSASGANKQPLKYILSCAESMNARIFACLGWAAYLKEWPGPREGERPAAYIVILGDTAIQTDCDRDLGIAAQSIMLGATAAGLGGCMLGSINRRELQRILGPLQGLEILLVIALGTPREEVVIEAVGPDGEIRYWRDAEGVHHVPKRQLEDIIVASFPP